MGLFNFGKKKETQEENRQPGNPTTMILFRLLAVGYVLWMYKDIVKAYIEGAADAPSLTMVIVVGLVFGLGCVWILWESVKQYKRMKIAQQEYNERVAEEYRLEEEAAARAKAVAEEYEEEYEEYEEYDEEEIEDEE